MRHGQPEAGNSLRLSGVLNRGPKICPPARGAVFRPLAQNATVKQRRFCEQLCSVVVFVQDATSVTVYQVDLCTVFLQSFE